MLFLGDGPDLQQRVLEGVMRELKCDEAEARRAALVGSPADIKPQIEQLAELGVNNIIVWHYPTTHVKSLLRFSEEVIPAFR